MTFITNNIETSGLTATTIGGTVISGTSFYGDGSNITNTPDTFISAATFNGATLELTDTNNVTINATVTDLSGVTFGGFQAGDSRLKHWAEMYNDNNTLTTTINTSGVAVKVNTTSVLGGARGFSHTDNRLIYTASTTGQTFEVTATIAGTAQSGSQLAQFSMYKNSTTEITPTISETILTSTKNSLSLTGTLEIGNGDFIELWVQNNTSNKNFDVETWTVRIAQI